VNDSKKNKERKKADWTNENIKRRLNSGNIFYVKFDPEIFAFAFLYKNVTCEMYTFVFFSFLMGVAQCRHITREP
jgi:hypothetical protein